MSKCTQPRIRSDVNVDTISLEVVVLTLKQAVVKRVTEKCGELNIATNALANICGVTPSTIYSLLDDSRNDVMLSTVKKICDGLEMTLHEFFSSDYFNKLDQEIK